MKTKCPSCDGINQFDFDYMCGPGTFYDLVECDACACVYVAQTEIREDVTILLVGEQPSMNKDFSWHRDFKKKVAELQALVR